MQIGLRGTVIVSRPLSALVLLAVTAVVFLLQPQAAHGAGGGAGLSEVAPRREIGGVYLHLACFNDGAECGIGAVVPWADRLWVPYAAPALCRARQRNTNFQRGLAAIGSGA